MVAKGLDFDRVTLVGVINADLQLYLPDFRASERTFQLLTQVSGRAGRTSDKPGEVFIQTSHTDNHSIQSVKQSSYQTFYNAEIDHRKMAHYPPYTRFNIIEFSGRDFKKVDKHIKIFAGLFPSDNKYFSLLGPVEPVIPKIRLNYRRILVLKNNKNSDPSGNKFRNILQQVYRKYRTEFNSTEVKIVIDIDSFAGL
jgi:primosomal protein N' (replication factor Y)